MVSFEFLRNKDLQNIFDQTLFHTNSIKDFPEKFSNHFKKAFYTTFEHIKKESFDTTNDTIYHQSTSFSSNQHKQVCFDHLIFEQFLVVGFYLLRILSELLIICFLFLQD